MAYKRKKELKHLSAKHIMAWNLRNEGNTFKQIGKTLGIVERTAWTYVKDVQTFLLKDESFLRAQFTFMTKAIGKATEVVLKYLDGKGSKDGGDLDIAVRVLENAGILQGKTKEGGIAIDNRIITALNADIIVNPPEDKVFASDAPRQLERIAATIKRLTFEPMDGETGES